MREKVRTQRQRLESRGIRHIASTAVEAGVSIKHIAFSIFFALDLILRFPSAYKARFSVCKSVLINF